MALSISCLYSWLTTTTGVSYSNCSGFSRKQTKIGVKIKMAQQQIGEKAVRKDGRTAADWQDVDTLLPVGPANTDEIKRRYGVNAASDMAYKKFIYFPCRQQRGRCKFMMRWAKQGGLLQQHGQHNHAVEEAPAKQQQQQAAVDWQQKAVNGGTVSIRQICADHGVCQINNNDGSNVEVHFCCCKARCTLRVKWLLADGTVWTLGKHEQH